VLQGNIIPFILLFFSFPGHFGVGIFLAFEAGETLILRAVWLISRFGLRNHTAIFGSGAGSPTRFRTSPRQIQVIYRHGFSIRPDCREVRGAVTGVSLAFVNRTKIENCVFANPKVWGRKCQSERQALSDCSEEKYLPVERS
jgi:hypothetical protein